MTERENTRPTVGAAGREAESGDRLQTAHASAKDFTTIGGCGQMVRRELIQQLAPETAVNVLLACWDYLETGEKPEYLSPIENAAFTALIPDIEEA